MAERRPVSNWLKSGGVSVAIVSIIAGFEGYRSTAYRPIKGDEVTIGYGSTRYEDSSKVSMGDTIDVPRAKILLKGTADKMAQQAVACLGDVPLYEWEWNAYMSFIYNVGPTAFCQSTLLKKLKQTPPDYVGACKELLKWTRAQGRVIPGLVARRQKEYSMCIGESQ